MPVSLAARLDVVKPSATLAINAKAQELRARGVDVISFGAGEPDFNTPENIRAAGVRAIDEGKTRYTPVSGIAPLRAAIAEHSAASRGVPARPENVVVTVGAKGALFNLALALFEPGDEVVVPTPCWVSYPEQVRLCGAEPVFVPSTLEAGWKISPDDLARALAPPARRPWCSARRRTPRARRTPPTSSRRWPTCCAAATAGWSSTRSTASWCTTGSRSARCSRSRPTSRPAP
jgi:aspartate aminotransferase